VSVTIILDLSARLGDSFTGWAIGTAMAALAALGVRTVRRYYYSRPTAAIWGVGEDQQGYEIVLPARVMPADETKAAGWPWMPMGDAYAVAIIVQTLRTLKRSARVEIYAAGELPFERRVQSNVVCIGGPSFNQITKELMEELSVPLEYTWDARSPGHPVMRSASGTSFISDVKLDAEGWQIVKSDWGAVVVAPNPYPDATRSNRRVFLVMGNGSQGTIAAARVLTVPDRQPLGPAILAYLLPMRLFRRGQSGRPYSRDILARFRESGRCAFLFSSRVERGYVSYPDRSTEVPWP
jgi:hypothetical protein